MWNDAVGVRVNCFSSPSTLERSFPSASIIDLKFPVPLGKLDAPKSCAMNTVSGTSYKKNQANLNFQAKPRESLFLVDFIEKF